jgi:hypothetical protein
MSEQTKKVLCLIGGILIGLLIFGIVLREPARPAPLVFGRMSPALERAFEDAIARWRVCPSTGCTQSRTMEPDGTVLIWIHDDGRFAGSPLKSWFDGLKSGKGLCCSYADGVTVRGVDWDTKDGHYRVRLDGRWIIVPDAAVVTEPNKFGQAVVWPYVDWQGKTQIRCFIAGAGT